METFFEQLIKINKTGATVVKSALIVLGFVLLTVIVSFAAIVTGFGILIMPAVALFAFLGYKVVTSFNIEYEYILTNGILDIDKIINMSKRKRILSFDCAKIEKVERFNPNAQRPKSDTFFMCCNADDNAFCITVRREKGVATVVIAPNEKLTPAIKKYLPKIILKDAFI